MEKKFQKIFGCSPKEIRECCLILPSNDAGLFRSLNLEEIRRGLFFNVQSSEGVSLVSLKDRSLAGDCVMYLKDTSCSRVVLMGSCGGITLECGDIGIVYESLNLESFSRFLAFEKDKAPETVKPSKAFFENILQSAPAKLKKIRCATLSSFYLQEQKLEVLKSNGVDCVDMEASMVFSAADCCGMEAVAVFYCADQPGKINFYDNFSLALRNKIKSSKKNLSKIVIEIIGK
ncbi:MAG: hypothetical protein ACQESB_03020 [Elusimicrobiota bacterium]